MKGLLHSLFGKMDTPRYQYDAFISHAVEDKLPIANELCARLEQAGLKIWYSGRELSVGDRVSESIGAGLRKSRFGIVILSPSYIQKNWTMREFYSLLAKEEYEKVILPVLFEITPEELLAKDITMADTFALRAEKGMDYLVESLTAVIGRDKGTPSVRQQSGFGRFKIAIMFAILLLAGVGVPAFLSLNKDDVESQVAFSRDVAEQLLSERLRDLDLKASAVLKDHPYSLVSSGEQVAADADEYLDLKTHYRNEYRLDNGFSKVQSKKNVEAALQVAFDTMTLVSNYKMSTGEVSRAEVLQDGRTLRYVHRNTSPASFDIKSMNEISKDIWEVDVRFSNNIRLIETMLFFPDLNDKEPRKRHQVRIMATLPSEKYLFRKSEGRWVLEYFPKSKEPDN